MKKPVFRGSQGPGVPVRTATGSFGEHQWSRRWIADFEALAAQATVGRARAAARARWVLDVQIGWRRVLGTVQGSQPEPFAVEFECAPLDEIDRHTVRERLADTGLPAALAGRVSDELAGLLLPPPGASMRWSCTCPDQPGPCKHVLAVAYVIVERIDSAPQELFRLRGYPPRGDDTVPGKRGPAGSTQQQLDAGGGDLAQFWDADPALSPAPQPHSAVADLLDGPVAQNMARAIASGNTLATLAILADLEDLYRLLRHGGSADDNEP